MLISRKAWADIVRSRQSSALFPVDFAVRSQPDLPLNFSDAQTKVFEDPVTSPNWRRGAPWAFAQVHRACGGNGLDDRGGRAGGRRTAEPGDMIID
jgi:hypothetical protein